MQIRKTFSSSFGGCDSSLGTWLTQQIAHFGEEYNILFFPGTSGLLQDTKLAQIHAGFQPPLDPLDQYQCARTLSYKWFQVQLSNIVGT